MTKINNIATLTHTECIINFIFLFMEQLSKFKTPMPLVYRGENGLLIVSELDLSKKDNLVGIKFDRFTMSLTQDKISWYNAYWMIEHNCLLHKVPRLPDETDCGEWCRYAERVNATLQIIKEQGINADLLDVNGIYWLRNKFSHIKSFAYMMKERLKTLRDKFDEDSCLARVIWYN